jgi:prophage antirepressor-like protein
MPINGEPWFIGSDVSIALEYRDAGNMTRNLDDDEKGTQIVSTLGGEQQMLVINESGLYSAILRSRKPAAKRFKKWVTAEVLPSIRKAGRYDIESTQGAPEIPALALQRWLTSYDSTGQQHTRLLPMNSIIMTVPDLIEHLPQMNPYELPTNQLFALAMKAMGMLQQRKVNFAGFVL